MKKVVNYGSFLQAFALMKIIKKLRPETKIEFIDIKPGVHIYPQKQLYQFVIRKLETIFKNRHKIKYIFQYVYKIRAMFIFGHVLNKFLNIVKRKRNWETIFNTIVIGSDEVFNCLQDVPWGFSKNLLGDGLNSNNIITYAASCGKTTSIQVKNMNLAEEVKRAFQNIKKFSVRDQNTYEFVLQFAQKSSLIHLDPVFLFNYDSYIEGTAQYRQPYILIYAYPDRISDKEEISAIYNFANYNKLRIINIAGYQSWCKTNLSLNPFDVLAYFKKATYVVTDTFHGVVFSIKYNKQFVVFVRDNNSNKLKDLLARFSLESREINSVSKFDEKLNERIDFKSINKFIDMETKKSMAYLDEYL
jgi:hypothetical protein